MSKFDYDLIVIGAGSGGTRTARISASYGAKTLVVEGDRAGGTCVLRGCVPKKLLVYASQFSEQVSDAEGFCWQVKDYESNWGDLIKKKNKELDRLHEIYVNLIKNSGCDLISGWGKILSPNLISITKDNNEVIEKFMVQIRQLKEWVYPAVDVKLPFLKPFLKRKFSNIFCCFLGQFSLRKQGWR